ncbi:unnamed protein product [Amaranthus hypochondriacus]
MATNSSSYIHNKQSYLLLLIILFIFFIFIINSCNAARIGKMINQASTNSFQLKHQRIKHDFANRGLVFNLLPKGRRVSPSGPSKQHNSMVDSIHN